VVNLVHIGKGVIMLEEVMEPKGKKYQCQHPDCGYYFDEPRVSEGGFKICPVCGAFSYKETTRSYRFWSKPENREVYPQCYRRYLDAQCEEVG
jgi:hypothetical protein